MFFTQIVEVLIVVTQTHSIIITQSIGCCSYSSYCSFNLYKKVASFFYWQKFATFDHYKKMGPRKGHEIELIVTLVTKKI